MVSRPVVSARPVGDYSAGSPKVCTVRGCDRKAQARGWCQPHYHRWRRYGDPLGTPRQYVDEVAVDRAVHGDPPAQFRPADRRAAVAVLTERRLSAREIAVRLRMSQRAVERFRSQVRAAS